MGLIHITRRLIRVWALSGGFILIGIILMTAYSASSNLFFSAPLAGDFEIVEMGVALAVFCFLPLCQLDHANVSADIFTMKAGPRAIALMSLFASLLALSFALLLLWRMSLGMGDYREYEEYTAILGIPIWIVFPPILFSLGLLVLASMITTGESVRTLLKLRDATKP